MGAARAVQLKADEVPLDGLAIAQALAAELKDGGYDLILFGRMATDTASGTVGPMTAELLGLPCVTAISHLEIADGQGTARRDLEGAAETVRVPAPGGVDDRRGDRAAAARDAQGDHGRQEEAARDVKPAALGEARLTVEAMALPPERPAGASSARAPTRCPSWCGGSGPKRRCCDGGDVRVRGNAGWRAPQGGARGGDGGAARRPTRPAAVRCTRCCSARPASRRKAEALGRYGADLVIVVEHAGLERYNPEVVAATAAERLRAGEYRAAFFSASAEGRDLAPRVAAKLGVGLASDVTAFEIQGDALLAQHPAYTGKIIVTLRLTGTPAIVSLRPGAVTPAEQPRTARIEAAEPAMDPAAARVVVTELTHTGRQARPGRGAGHRQRWTRPARRGELRAGGGARGRVRQCGGGHKILHQLEVFGRAQAACR